MRKIFFLLLITLSCLCSSGISNAGDNEESAPGFDACMDKAETTAAMLECVSSGIDYWDKALAENYALAEKECPFESEKECAEYRARLGESMQTWQAYRDATAAHLGQASGGSVDSLSAAMFILEVTKIQADSLGQ